jgi:hypothetical protein
MNTNCVRVDQKKSSADGLILAIDLGKYKGVACACGAARQVPQFDHAGFCRPSTAP